ncbi:hypothetical protein [Sphingomonas endolithica]|uniref:hypothetical protein n=1 Tax=Sphingomonas endolithica TaxID=2972485 RepID=UPI0021AEACCE|nr:hypothetical protein [Sphingomonas sp. ZFBP2030]
MQGRSLAIAVMLAACGCAQPADASAGALGSGFYEGFLLAVSPGGRVVGHFDMEQGMEVIKRCTFDFVGRASGNQATIRTIRTPSLNGRITADTAGDVTFSMAHVRDLPGCGLVVPPEAEAAGTQLSRIRPGNWTELARVTGARVAFKATPSGRARRRYVVKGDVVGILARRGNQLLIVYPSERDTWPQGWVSAADLAPLAP